MLEISQNASTHLAELLRKDAKGGGKAKGLRLAVKEGGCAGLQYILSLDSQQENDHVFPCEGGLIFIDRKSFSYLKGSSLEYEDGLTQRGFFIQNPRAQRHCGCGTSFEFENNS